MKKNDRFLQHYEEDANVKQEWDNIKITLRKTAEKFFRNFKVTQKAGPSGRAV